MPERQTYDGSFNEFDTFIEKLESDSLKPYVLWEFNFLKKMGYGIDLDELEIKDKIKDLLYGQNVDFVFDDLKDNFTFKYSNNY